MKILIVAGGTGGHINPGIAIANMLKEEKHEIVFVGTKKGMEIDLVPKAGYRLRTIRASSMKRGFSFKNIKTFFDLIYGISDAKKVLKEEKPDLVIGTGGYVTAPIMIAASKSKIPTIIHESNALPGKTTSWLSKKVDIILVGFKDTVKRLPNAKKVIYTGNPTKMNKILDKSEVRKRLGITKPLVLVFGGSQGAKKINETMIELINKNKVNDYQLIYATGPKNYNDIISKIKVKGDNIRIEKYIYNMEEVMAASDLVVSRSGALTTTEISIVGVASILIPFPFAAENHQLYNAETLKKVSAAEIILEKNLTTEKLDKMIQSLITNPERLNKMGENAKKNANFDALNNIKKVLIEEADLKNMK